MNHELAAVFRALNRRIRGLQKERREMHRRYGDEADLEISSREIALAEATFLRDCIKRELGEARKKAGARE